MSPASSSPMRRCARCLNMDVGECAGDISRIEAVDLALAAHGPAQRISRSHCWLYFAAKSPCFIIDFMTNLGQAQKYLCRQDGYAPIIDVTISQRRRLIHDGFPYYFLI